MTLTETFAHHTSQEFPPKFVFCFHDGKPKTIMVSEIAEYETMYVPRVFVAGIPCVESI